MPALVEESEEKQYEIITSFGMFWRKDMALWNVNPRLLGIQQIGAEPVNFNKQLGIYLLYHGREVIYVGRATERPLGRRLYEHTLDRLSTRWDRFSWFGLLPVSENGSLAAMPAQYGSEQLIPALEAILIEALEPRQNRRRGDDLEQSNTCSRKIRRSRNRESKIRSDRFQQGMTFRRSAELRFRPSPGICRISPRIQHTFKCARE